LTWWTEYQARRGSDRKSLYVNNMKNTISTEFKNSTSYNLVKINDVDRDVRIVEESAIIKNPNKKRLLCYPDETISIGDIIIWDSENWICTETDTTSQISDVGIISKCNNVINLHINNTPYQIPCIVNSNVNLDTDETIYIETPSTIIVLKIPNTEITRQIKRGEIYKLGLQNYEIKDINDIVENGILRLEIEYSQEVQEEHIYIIEITNGSLVDVQESTTLQLNVNVYDNGQFISPAPSLLFVSSDETVCNVDENGLITAYDVIDNCDITVSLDSDSSVFDIININVIDVPQDNYTVIISGANSIIKGYPSEFSATFMNNGIEYSEQSEFYLTGDDGISPTSLTQITSQDNVANSCVVKGLGIGYVKLFVRSSDGSIVSDGFRIQVKNLF